MKIREELESLDIQVHDPIQLEHLLTEAEVKLRNVAMAAGTSGILVTRLNSRHYKMELSSNVPFGHTLEHCLQQHRQN